MSDSYEIDGVKIEHQGGGYYDLSHEILDEPERIRGKEDAEARAAEIAAASRASEPAGSMEPQAPIEPASVTESQEQIDALKARLKQAEDERDKYKDQVKTVVMNDDVPPPPPENTIPAAVPREFRGEMDKNTRKAMKKMGVGVTTIILEENDDIPPTGLFLGHNGRGYMIVPGEKVDVPDFLLNVLDDAVMAAPITDSKSRKVLGYRSRMKYSYRRV